MEEKKGEEKRLDFSDSRFAKPFPSPRGADWRSSASPGSGRGRSPTAASSSAARGPPPRPINASDSSLLTVHGGHLLTFSRRTKRTLNVQFLGH